MICYEFMTDGHYAEHLDRNREIYRKKCGLMTALLDEHLGKYVEYVKPDGGLFIWCKLPESADMTAFCTKAVENKVATVPGTAFTVDTTAKSNCFRINYSTPTDEQIVLGMEILGRTAKNFFD